ncbi:Transcription factor bhlh [Thalictrum thalictroides]|uniref:Transcription factor bhlh n=1 Tax=Thalictrum thalictroides TaxID=46969 RepID=A0A7J6XGF2_THATH|nr:Transcription factor bhlh [Thalictrum thalictroides]
MPAKDWIDLWFSPPKEWPVTKEKWSASISLLLGRYGSVGTEIGKRIRRGGMPRYMLSSHDRDPAATETSNNEIQVPPPIPDISLNVCESSFLHDSEVCNDIHLGSFAPMSTMEIPQSFNTLHLPGWLTSTTTTTTASTLDKTMQLYRQSRSSVPDMEAVATENGRKRKMNCESVEEKRLMDELKKNKVLCMEDRSTQKNQEKKAPAKRSQKISDKITALQKLVSPFGKTDTASVLQEACTYIKYLHEQIEMLTAPYFSITALHPQGHRRSNWDLSSRGLCLVPVSFTNDLTKADHDHVERSASRGRGATVLRKY